MQTKDLIKLIKNDVSGFTNKTNDIKDHYLVKIKMNDYVYESQSIFYALFENSEEFSDADNIAFANIDFHKSVVLISILGTLNKRGFFNPLAKFFYCCLLLIKEFA